MRGDGQPPTYRGLDAASLPAPPRLPQLLPGQLLPQHPQRDQGGHGQLPLHRRQRGGPAGLGQQLPGGPV